MQNCPNVLAHGTCSDQACPFLHNIVNCEPCGLIFDSHHNYQQHIKSNRHIRRLAGQGVTVSCPICSINVYNGQKGWAFHIMTRKHKAALGQAGVKEDAVGPQEGLTRGNIRHCDVCHVSVPLHAWSSHVQGPKHRSREAYAKYESVLGEAAKDKNGLIVEGDLDFGYVDPHSPSLQTDRRRIVEIKSSQALCHSTLLQVNLATSQGMSRITSAYVVESYLLDHSVDLLLGSRSRFRGQITRFQSGHFLSQSP